MPIRSAGPLKVKFGICRRKNRRLAVSITRHRGRNRFMQTTSYSVNVRDKFAAAVCYCVAASSNRLISPNQWKTRTFEFYILQADATLHFLHRFLKVSVGNDPGNHRIASRHFYDKTPRVCSTSVKVIGWITVSQNVGHHKEQARLIPFLSCSFPMVVTMTVVVRWWTMAENDDRGDKSILARECGRKWDLRNS